MARMIADPRTATTVRPAAPARTHRHPSVNRPSLASTVPQTVLGDRVADARPKTRVPRRSNRAVGREMMTVLCASFVVTMLCMYVSAYARVTAESFEMTRLNQKIQKAELLEQTLKAAISKHEDMKSVAQRAQSMGLVPGEPTNINLVPADKGGTATKPVEDAPIVPEQENGATP